VIILDTNALSETLKPVPSSILLRWLASQDPISIYTTAISQAEMLYGVEALPTGRRRQLLARVVEEIFAEDFPGRVLPFDRESAREFAKIVARRKAAGRPISQFDAMIAAIARSQSAAVATRNTGDFELCGLRLINPWAV
jgi:predicted nucleic acid-binding protein